MARCLGARSRHVRPASRMDDAWLIQPRCESCAGWCGNCGPTLSVWWSWCSQRLVAGDAAAGGRVSVEPYAGTPPHGEKIMYAAIRQGTAKAGMAEELARRIKEGAIPVIIDVPGFQAYYVIYAPNDTVTAISIFDAYAGAQESNRRG